MKIFVFLLVFCVCNRVVAQTSSRVIDSTLFKLCQGDYSNYNNDKKIVFTGSKSIRETISFDSSFLFIIDDKFFCRGTINDTRFNLFKYELVKIVEDKDSKSGISHVLFLKTKIYEIK